MAVLADTRESFRPSSFTYQRWGCEVNFTFPSAKLIDWEQRWSELESSENVFALVVRAQIHAKRIKDGASRQQVKIGLVRLLYERGYSREQVIELFNIIDWMIQLPEGLEQGFVQTVFDIQEEKQMTYINTIERVQLRQATEEGVQIGRQEGRQEGVQIGHQEALRNLLKIKFGELPNWALQRVDEATPEQLHNWMAAIFTADSLESMLGQH